MDSSTDPNPSSIIKEEEDKGTTKSLVDNIDAKDDNSKEEISGSVSLTENAYSLIYTSDVGSPAFYFGLFFSLFQSMFPILALINLINEKPNLFSVPYNIDNEVIVAGIFCIIISVPTFPDLLDSIERFHEGYDEESALKQSSGATRTKWLLAFFLQLVIGCMFQFVIFILIIQSNQVIGMSLNFAALGFITEIDDVSFSLAKRGYFPESVQKACEEVTKHKTPNHKSLWFRRICLLLITTILLAGYGKIQALQDKGEFMCKRIRAQFSDSYVSDLPLNSGHFKLNNDLMVDGRHVYQFEDDSSVFFRYCKNINSFVFGRIEQKYENEDDLLGLIKSKEYCKVGNPDYYIMRSAETEEYNILAVETSNWRTRKNYWSNFMYPVDYFTLWCTDCNFETCGNGVCNDNNDCICDDGTYGLQCQFLNGPCDSIQVDSLTQGFQPVTTPIDNITHDVSLSFKMLYTSDGKIQYVYARPMYGSMNDGHMDFLVFLGRRYFLFDVNYTGLTEVADLFASGDIDIYNIVDNYDVYYMSDPIDIFTPSDRIDPVGLNWYEVVKTTAGISIADIWSQGVQIDTVLVCADCVNYTDYGFLCPLDYSKCTEDNVCESFSE